MQIPFCPRLARPRLGAHLLAASSSLVLFALTTAHADTDAAQQREEIVVTAPSPVAKYDLPQTTATITADTIDQTINIMDTEDAIKYFPSLFVRKRNEGDTQPVLETRTWGVNSSARSLVYADDALISALIANNNTIGAPRWGLVAPEEIDRIDVLYGPFAAAYPGNSMGAVMLITTKMPETLEMTAKETAAYQNFSLYGTHKNYLTDQTSGSIGDKIDDFSWFLSANYQDSDSQPLIFVTNSRPPAGTSGTYLTLNKLGAVADVVGAGGILHTDMENVKLKLAYDFTPSVRLTYTFGFWANDATSQVQSYLTDANGNPTFGNVSGFASNNYNLAEHHLSNSLALKTDTKGEWDGEIIFTDYDFLDDIQRSPTGVTATGEGFTTNGRIARLDGTGWDTIDAKAIWRPGGDTNSAHEISFEVHGDRYVLKNPTYNTTNWQGGSDSGQSVFSNGRGETQTLALWAQDAWTFAPGLKLTLGGRFEDWEALNGYNFSGTVGVNQPSRSANNFSPKASLSWQPASDWKVTGSFGQAYRYPTVSELYQIVSTGATYSVPNANLKPEMVLSEELAIEHELSRGNIRLSLFQENVSDALISQTAFLTGATPYSYVVNVNALRNRGIELAVKQNDVAIKGLELSGSATYVNSIITSDPNFVSTTGTTATGKHAPYVPDWRATVEATYRPDEQWALTVAGRYSGKQYSTIDNTDSVSHVFGAFDSFLVFDTHVHYQITKNLALDAGIDNLNNDKYFLYHPFPQRTWFGDLKVKL
jgi:iron complex outermembrane receptor protein